LSAKSRAANNKLLYERHKANLQKRNVEKNLN